MKKLFDIERGQVIMNPTALWIPEFKKLWDRDKDENKTIATKEISYVVFKHGFHSPYNAYSEKEREGRILRDYFKGMPDWKPDKEIKAAEKKYNELQDSAALRLLRSTRKALEIIEDFFTTADPDQVDKVVKNAKELGGLIQSLNKLEVQVQKEQKEAASVRGEAEVGMFEL
jgi:hypothetical protein